MRLLTWTFLALPFPLLVSGCMAEVGESAPPSEGELAAASEPLSGPTETTNCESRIQRLLQRSVEEGRYVAVSTGFKQCIETTMQSGATLTRHGSSALYGPYLADRADPFRGSPIGTQVEKAMYASLSTSKTSMVCTGEPSSSDTSVLWGSASLGSWAEDRDGAETMNITQGVYQTANIDNDSNSSPADWLQSSRRDSADTVWHEAMHAWGYGHDNDGDAGYKRKIPPLVGACMETIMQRSLACSVSCGDDRRAVMRFDSSVCDCIENPEYDVGIVLERGDTCPTMPGRAQPRTLELYMDDEDDLPQHSSAEGWHGAIDSSSGTYLRFCVTSGLRFRGAQAANANDATYAVVRMGASCPRGSTSMGRYFDNEDDSNNNSSIGHVAPHGQGDNTQLELCMFRGVTGTPNALFPSLGVGYGVLAGAKFPNALATGSVYSDDENHSNRNRLTGNYAGSNAFLDDTSNTRLHFAKVKSADANSCGGTSGGWVGCRGNGCAVCSEKIVGYPKYFANHPDCVANGTCDNSFGTCNAACPAPSASDR